MAYTDIETEIVLIWNLSYTQTLFFCSLSSYTGIMCLCVELIVSMDSVAVWSLSCRESLSVLISYRETLMSLSESYIWIRVCLVSLYRGNSLGLIETSVCIFSWCVGNVFIWICSYIDSWLYFVTILYTVKSQYKTHFTRQLKCWSLRCSWSIACRRCSNYVFILHLTLGFNILRKVNCKRRRETFKFWDLVPLVLEILR